MWRHSGIGRYIREVVPRVAAQLPEIRWRLVGPSAAEWPVAGANVERQACTTRIYSWREHVGAPAALREAALCWIPHYNVPAGVRTPLLVTIHDLLPLRFSTGLRGRLRALLVRRYLRRAARARRVLTDSIFSGQELQALTTVAPARVRVVPLGVDAGRFAVPAGRAAWPGPFFLFVGNVKPHKNLATLLRVLAEHPAAFPERLVIVGRRDGFFTGDAAAQRVAAGLGARVDFTGEISDADLGAAYRAATAVVVPSQYEGFGLPVLEAMAAGCPVASARRASLPEVGGDAVAYFAGDDAAELAGLLGRLSRDAAWRMQLVAAGRARAAEFTWEKTAAATAAVVKEALQS